VLVQLANTDVNELGGLVAYVEAPPVRISAQGVLFGVLVSWGSG
jgi:hypothetical protein